MAVVKFSKIVIPQGDGNGLLKYLIGHKLGDREPAFESHRGRLVVFDTAEEAQSYINDED